MNQRFLNNSQRIDRLEVALCELITELGGSAQTHADIRNLVKRQPAIEQLLVEWVERAADRPDPPPMPILRWIVGNEPELPKAYGRLLPGDEVVLCYARDWDRLVGK